MALITTRWILDLILIFGGIAGLIYFYYRKKFRFWTERSVPHLKPTFPFGNVSGLTRTKSVGEIFKEIYDASKGEKFFGFWTFFRPMLLVRDLELVKTILVKDFMTFQNRGIYNSLKNDPLTAHIFTLGGERWRNIRNKLTPAFTSGKMKTMFPTMLKYSKEFDALLEEHARKQEIIEVKDMVARFATDITTSCAFGIEASSMKDSNAEFRRWGRQFFNPTSKHTFKNMVSLFFRPLAELMKLTRTPKDLTEHFLKAMKEAMDYREKNDIKRQDYLQLILDLKNHGKSSDDENEKDLTKFSFEESAAQLFLFYTTGFEGSSITLEFCLYELSLNPDIQEKTREEIVRVLAEHNGVLSYEAVSEMKYVARVIDETLRKYPPLPYLQRECNRDYQIPGTDVVIPKGTIMIISHLAIQMDQQHYTEPEKFDPDRFSEEEKSKRHQCAYLPFGTGPKNCIAVRFGLMQARMGLITLLAKYKFEVAKETPIPLEMNPKVVTLAVKGGMYLKISKV